MVSTPRSVNNLSSSVASPTGDLLPTKPRGLTLRAVVLSLALAVFFGYIIPIVDMKMRNTFLGATHLPPGAIAILLILLLASSYVLHEPINLEYRDGVRNSPVELAIMQAIS